MGVRPILYRFVDLFDSFCTETLSEMYHHRRIKQRLRPKFLQPNKILRVRVLCLVFNRPFICQIFLFFDIYRSVCD